ncbi:hypothetical protein PN480_02340 [Dolichospermum circinale CS-1225]|uniref:DUF2281 domain-containing protein n=1 Tax=Dolichospermum circinale CS-537/01 TaxID=3021739 RepID=A0ABT5A051_9CYAN|nr:hypothetical protein [Dolichospermum circinale]MDB9467166.1 hypothetical protein [Dolichospermum circinale CS-539/09]MDB9472897.1 hypothetical protein [Dolichospermum circinale CS-539]MDB9485290.1 hypothetical protein [Dolichospermum circinale CS-537/01]MDB9520791.1 hypothetical protein [Dolichospermum circinale CS-1225]
MTNSTTIRQELLKQISLIPDEKLSYVLEFIQKMNVTDQQTNDNDKDIADELLDMSASALQDYLTGKDKGISSQELKRQLLGEDFA